ncbi:MAG: Nucleoside 2-deoxyribosyltransferase [Syntrophorhabdus sp. PtaU1.Bin153]|nr:MAG: Nucleoside 2-deoxyribosyltransferase [Syntrophorhabdus sp. PtaU1.Bin153]
MVLQAIERPLAERKEGMKIYFAGSIRGGRDDAPVYEAMIAWLQTFGEVLNKHVGDPALSEAGDDGPSDRSIHDRDMAWLSACDLVVAEVSVPSLGVGYELGWATALNKPVLCLNRTVSGRPLSAMIAGSPRIRTVAYSSLNEANTVMRDFIRETARRASPHTGGFGLSGDDR